VKTVANTEVVPLRDIPEMPVAAFREEVVRAVESGHRLSALFGAPAGDARTRLYGVVAQDDQSAIGLASTVVGENYPALTPACPQAHLFEREILDQFGVIPEGHPWPRPVRQPQWDFFRMEGEEVHEVAVGPVHAGIIEPGHFRFQCHGEHVFHLEIALGYQHRGVERALAGGPDRRTLHYMETLAGDTTVGHATAYAHAAESLAGARVPPRAEALRAIALELERLANHCGDLGALANDIGFLPTASYCGRLRGDFLNLSALLCGSRFGRGMVRLGGTSFDADDMRAVQFVDRLNAALRDAAGAAALLWDTPSVMARFEETGTVPRETALELGLVGPAARASGVSRDVRRDFPSGMYCFAQVPVATWESGDVFARAYVRWLEMERSAQFIKDQLQTLPAGAIRGDVGGLQPDALVVSLVEGWRGEICHVAITDERGRFSRYKVVDPSFHNWTGLALALRDQQISDFPLCNKSFNLSYCGHDL
jgi:Ni,Fe-hydrogenase III large subunit